MKKILFDTTKNKIYNPPQGLLNTPIPNNVIELDLIGTEAPYDDTDPLVEELVESYVKEGDNWVQKWNINIKSNNRIIPNKGRVKNK